VILDRFRLDGQVAVITGGNRGLGLHIALALAEAGADIVSVQHAASAPALVEKTGKLGRRALAVGADLKDDRSAEEVLSAALQAFGRVDVLVNNAGIQRRTPSERFPLADWDEVMAINLRAVFVYSQAFGRHFLAQGRGKIINIASVQSLIGGWTIPAYTASKHGLAGLTKTLCNEWAGRGVNVNCIAPGYMDTEMTAALKADPERSRAINERIPAGRWGQPADLAGAAVFLASAASDYINGHVLVVDGGWMAR
jgi:2-dehydro-3-deoxy-D-gluconate 5-dehydrogenase